jgi:hypothetical protein
VCRCEGMRGEDVFMSKCVIDAKYNPFTEKR